MRQRIKIELIVYFITLAAVAVFMHPDLLSDPASRFSHMLERQNYFHPFIYSFIIYLLAGLLRVIVIAVKKIIQKR